MQAMQQNANQTELQPSDSESLPGILIYGAGGHAKAMIETIIAQQRYRVSGLIDDSIPAGTKILGFPVLGDSSLLSDLFRAGNTLIANAVGGIGNVQTRIDVFERLLDIGFAFPSLLHPAAFIEPSAIIDPGVHIMPLSYVGSDANVGFGTIVNAGVCISHDCNIGQIVNLSPHATLGGNVTLADYVQVGMGATINLGVTVGSRARVGNSAVVKKDVPPNGRVWAGSLWPIR